MARILHVPSFGAGVALVGSADVQRTDELQACDSYDIGERGQLIAASDLSNVDQLVAPAGNLGPIWGMALGGTAQARYLLVVGDGFNGVSTLVYVVRYNLPAGTQGALQACPIDAQGRIITFASFPFVDRLGVQQRPTLMCIAPRETQDPRSGGGVFIHHDSGGGFAEDNCTVFDYLGTGSGQYNEATAGTKAKQFYPRGIAVFNNHIFFWGFDNKDATKGDGPNRLMFANLANPFKVGNDPGTAGDRDFADTDAINIGGSGEMIRAGYPWAGKFYIGTNRELHSLAGYGRESFTTNGAVGIQKSLNVCGPNCLIEGPDGLLYGVSTEGLWQFDGGSVEHLYRKLVDFKGKSNGWWDLIWRDATRGTNYPGQTNQDLVWMLSDPETMQVWVVIPHCSAANGYGYGVDTVIIKYNVQTEGFTRQVIIGQALTAGLLMHRELGSPTKRFVGQQSGGGAFNLRAYAAKADATVSPIMPVALPDVTFGEYSPFGPDGYGVNERFYLVLSWEAAASLPIVLSITPSVDQQAIGAVTLSIQLAAPGAPANGDLWLDTSGTDTNLGNATAGVLIPAAADYVLKRWITSWNKWVLVPGGGGEKGTRVTIPIAFTPTPGGRVKARVQTVSAVGRYQIEGLGLAPALIREAQ